MKIDHLISAETGKSPRAKRTYSLHPTDSQTVFLELLWRWLFSHPQQHCPTQNLTISALVEHALDSRTSPRPCLGHQQRHLSGKPPITTHIHSFRTGVPMLLPNWASMTLSRAIFLGWSPTLCLWMDPNACGWTPMPSTLLWLCLFGLCLSAACFPSWCFHVFSSLVFVTLLPWVSILPLLLGSVKKNCERL